MLVSRHYGFIYLRVPRTAGTSIGLALNKICKKCDIAAKLPNVEDYESGATRIDFPTHGKLPRIMRWINDHYNCDTSDYRVISVIRNPWERLASHFYYFRVRRNRELLDVSLDRLRHEFRKHLRDAINKSRSADDLLFIGNKCIVTDPIRFTHLQEDYDKLSESFGFPSVEIPQVNGSSRGENYRDLYNPELIETVSNLEPKTIRRFGFTFN